MEVKQHGAQQAIEEFQSSNSFTPSTLNYLRMAGIQVPSALPSIQTGTQGVAVKRPFSDVKQAIIERQSRDHFAKPTDV